MKRLFAPIAVLALLLAVAAGCGGSGGSSKNKAYASSVSAYVAALNTICAPAIAKARALNVQTMADIAANGDKFKSIQLDAIDKMDSLQPPDQIKSTVDDFVSKSREEASKFGDLVSAAKAGDTAKAQQLLAEIRQLNVKTNAELAKIGATKCVAG